MDRNAHRVDGRAQVRKTVKCWAFELEPPIGIESMTYALRGVFDPSTVVHQVTPVLPSVLRIPFTSRIIGPDCHASLRSVLRPKSDQPGSIDLGA